ncbi:S9 family peptidase [Christiangramia sp. OXR-203]|uniref:S9 family peptidase n=1 Tax=Christiangramia sp. OXR-203 TaxID=3100176 RepID=UPI002AC99892|nr:DPP IV N-terminal domain-containing protein [Christiangramia sp. OXR-203]WPZ00037.1 DPP IV N-terminal domain-containing protein [Christiangramia sp. OXR-203]
MKNYLLVLIVFITFSSVNSQNQDSITAEDYANAEKFLSYNTNKKIYRSYVYPQWLENGNFWYRVTTRDGSEFVLVKSKTGAKSTFTTKEELLANIESGSEENGRYSRIEVASPDGNKLAYIKDWNLWIKDAVTGEETQLTKDGIENYGYATDNAGWRKSDKPILLWSPDSKKIATFRQDQRHVSDMYLASTKVGAPELQQWKYPLPGDEKVIQIERVIINTENSEIIPLKIPQDPRRGTLCDDISCSGAFDDNQWSEDSKELAFVSTSRDHKIAKFRIANATTGEVREVFEEKVDTQYESGQGSINWKYFPESSEIIWYSERDDWGHLYLYDSNTGKLKNQITKGEFVVTEVLKFNAEDRMIYFMANGKDQSMDPYFAQFYSIRFDGKRLQNLTPEDANHRISISPDSKYFVDNYSKPDTPNKAVLKKINGKQITELEKADITDLEADGWKPAKRISVKSRNGDWDLYGLMFTPTHLDENKSYPVVNYIYPGPQGGGVGSRSFYPSRSDHQALAELGFIVVIIDGTCNPNRSKSFHDACYGNMADNTLEDQISGLKQLAEKYPYMDLDRVGIWGHSGGGFATAAALFNYPEFYKVGISESGNHDNRNYEDDWGERYIGLLRKDEDGSSNYAKQANQNMAENLEGKLLLAHGAMDDNVPPYNTYLVVDALIEANKDFDLIIFPHARHGFGKDSYYMMRRRWDYFVEHLMNATPPQNYELGPKS